MFCAAKTDTLCAEVACLTGVAGSIGVSAYKCLCVLVGKIHDSGEVTVENGFGGGNLTVVYFTGGTIERDPVAFLVGLSAHFDGLGHIVDLDFAGAGNAALAHAACNHSCVGSHAAAHSQDTLSHGHTAKVLGRCFDADKDDFAFLFSPVFGIFR